MADAHRQNRAVDRVRAKRGRSAIAVEPGLGPDGEPRAADGAETHETPEQVLQATNTAGAVRAAMAGLPDAGQLIEAAFFEGYSHRELAAGFELPLGTVKRGPHRPDGAARSLGAGRMIPDELEALALADSVGALDADERAELGRPPGQAAARGAGAGRTVGHAVMVVADSVELVEPSARVRERVLAAVRTPGRYTVHAGEADWFEKGLAGIRAKVLAVDRARSLATLLIRAEPGAVYPSQRHHAPEECYGIRGLVVIHGRVLQAGDFHHADAESDHGEMTTVDAPRR